jgi:hypothetical protein
MTHSLTINDQTFISETWDIIYKRYLEEELLIKAAHFGFHQ